jgi:FkbM family methyltransferase
VLVETEWFAQYGEDRKLAEMFPVQSGVFVEVGAADGVIGSNTLYFERLGWDGLLVEANPIAAAKCREVRRVPVVECAVVAPGTASELEFTITPDSPHLSGLAVDPTMLRTHHLTETQTVVVRTSTLDDVLTEHLDGRTLDFVTIDVEGNEWDVLQGFTLNKWQPKVVIIERNFWPDWRILRLLHRDGYGYVGSTGVNDWFKAGMRDTRVRLVRSYGRLGVRSSRSTLKWFLDRTRLLPTAVRLRDKVRSRRARHSA